VRLALTTLMTVVLLGIAAQATAQPAPPAPGPPTRVSVTPWEVTREVGVTLGVWNLMDEPSSVGGRYTRRYGEWLAGELSIDVRHGSSAVPGGSGLAIADARFMTRDRAAERDWFVTVGVAAGNGLSFGVSPMVGVGMRWHVEDIVALRLEVQRFPPPGAGEETRGRLGMSADGGAPEECLGVGLIAGISERSGWSGLRESNPSSWLGKPEHYHYAKPARSSGSGADLTPVL
jgi:hypothetical protein